MKKCRLQTLSVWKSLKFVVWEWVNPLADDSDLNSLKNDKYLDLAKLKAFADIKLDVGKIIISLFDRVQNIAGK